MKTDTTSMGLNLTGIGTSPTESEEMIKAAEEGCSCAPPGGAAALALVRQSYENEAEPIGTVPLPVTLRCAFAKSRGAAVFIDKLGERLAFERTGARLYEALLTKVDTSPGWPLGPTKAEVKRFHDEELAHLTLLHDSLEAMGADPTAQTPSADVVGTASIGLIQVVTDPRTTLPQSLNALLTAELTDNDGWQMLVDLARTMGLSDMAACFQRAQEEEVIHLNSVRGWLSAAAKAGAGTTPDPAKLP